jgi:hypothetical protein
MEKQRLPMFHFLLLVSLPAAVAAAAAAGIAVISELAAGGQVLLDAATFRGVKDAGHELGCVDEGGVNLSQLEAAAWATLLCPWSRWADRISLCAQTCLQSHWWWLCFVCIRCVQGAPLLHGLLQNC